MCTRLVDVIYLRAASCGLLPSYFGSDHCRYNIIKTNFIRIHIQITLRLVYINVYLRDILYSLIFKPQR